MLLGAMLFGAWRWGQAWLPILDDACAWGGDPVMDPTSPGFNPQQPQYAPGPYGTNPFARPFSGPVVPTDGIRPSTWPGGKDLPIDPPRFPANGVVPASLQRLEPIVIGPGTEKATILARVGSEVIQYVEVSPSVEEELAQRANEIGPSQLDAARLALTKQRLRTLIETKLVMADAHRNIPADNLPKIEKKIDEQFEKSQMKTLMESTKSKSRAELEQNLKKIGSSIENQRRAYNEQSFAMGWISEKIKEDGEITHEEMLEYYRQHAAAFETPAKARWEQITIKFEKHSRQEAKALLAQLGNQIWYGAPFAKVAQAHSEDASASDGGIHEWTTQGSLVSTTIDGAIFSPNLPVGRLSQILEDENGCYIVRVIERKDLYRKPFIEAQAEIKKKIKEEKRSAQIRAYLEKLRKQTPVWTVFDPPKVASQPSSLR